MKKRWAEVNGSEMKGGAKRVLLEAGNEWKVKYGA